MKYAFAYPILPGKEDFTIASMDQLLGPRRSEYDDFQRRMGVQREAYFLQRSPAGSMVIVVGEGSDDSGGVGGLDPEHHEVDRFMVETFQEATGIDPSTVEAQPPAEFLGEWSA